MSFTQALGGVLLLGCFIGACLLLVWQQWRVVKFIRRDDSYEIRDMWEGFRR